MVLQCSLLGHFTDYEIEANHVSSYAIPNSRCLTRFRFMNLSEVLMWRKRMGMSVGFMTNDIEDVNDTPDRIYFTDGSTKRSEGGLILPKSDIIRRHILDIRDSAESGWMYGNVLTPLMECRTSCLSQERATARKFPVRNFWQTDRTLRDGTDPAYEEQDSFCRLCGQCRG